MALPRPRGGRPPEEKNVESMNSKNSKSELLTARPGKLFLRYLFPGVAATMMVALNYFIDTLCVGQALGETGIAALNIAQPAPGVLYGLGYLFGVGGATLFSAYHGRKEENKARAVYTICLVAIVAVGLLILGLGLGFLDPIVRFMGGVGGLQQGVREYLLFVFVFAPFFAIETFMVTFTRNDNTPRLSMIATFCGCGLNIILDVLFLFGFGWGIWSASLATALAVAFNCCFLLVLTLRKSSGLKPTLRGLSPKELLAACKIGLPSFLQELTGSVVILTFNSVLLRISGETAVAVYGVIASMSLVVTSGLAGVSNAMHPLVSINAGAGKQARVQSFLKMAVVSSLLVSLGFLALGETIPEALIRVFVSPDAQFMAIAVPGVRIVFFSYLLVAANVLLGVYFQSVQSSGEAFALTLLRSVVLPVVTVMGCAFFFGVTGVWVATILAEALTLAAALWLFRRVRRLQREKNYSRLQYFGRRRAQQTVDGILAELGADDLAQFHEVIEACNATDEKTCGVPAFIGLDDLTSDYEGGYEPAYDDEDMGLLLAVGGLLFTDLYEQNEQYMKDKKLDETYPAAAPAMNALARRCFRFTYDEETEETTIIPYLDHMPGEEENKEAL